QKLREEGASGVLQSTYPSFTAPAWTSFITGLWPGKHGIFNFRSRPYPAGNPAGYSRPLMDSSALCGRTLWSYLTAHGISVGAVNFPVTYPPERVHGYMVCGMLAGGETDDYAYPAELAAEIRQLFPSYRVDMDYQVYAKGKEKAFLDNLYDVTSARVELALWLLENRPVDVFSVTFTNLDRIQHFMWQYRDPEHPCFDQEAAALYGPAIEDYYSYLDSIVGRILEKVPASTHVIIASDHGFGPIRKKLNVNKLLSDMGLIAFREASDGAMVIDWDQTRAYSGERAEMAVYISLRGRDPLGIVEEGEEYDAIVEQVRRALLGVVDPDTGGNVVTETWRADELFIGPYSSLGPDIVFKVRDSVYQPREEFPVSSLIEPSDWLSGGHRREGIFFAAGPAFKADTRTDADIVDVMPTVLQLLDLPIPAELDGKAMRFAFTEEFQSEHPVVYADVAAAEDGPETGESPYSEEDAERIEARLRGLGYL
ncbi:MAG: alkaline phosphatase family protein, partial [Chloroflexi bacterium]|nr:alkaline phosphatase family protein [Chloroflexota bacterium]